MSNRQRHNDPFVACFQHDPVGLLTVSDTHAYGTDGRVLLRRAGTLGVLQKSTEWEGVATSAMDFMFASSTPTGDPFPVSVKNVDAFLFEKKCRRCRGNGFALRRPCLTCDGTGERECDMGHTHECDDCDGNGTVQSDSGTPRLCQYCLGTGRDGADDPGTVKLAPGVTMTVLMTYRLILLGVTEARKTTTPHCIRFTLADGTEGLAMKKAVRN